MSAGFCHGLIVFVFADRNLGLNGMVLGLLFLTGPFVFIVLLNQHLTAQK